MGFSRFTLKWMIVYFSSTKNFEAKRVFLRKENAWEWGQWEAKRVRVWESGIQCMEGALLRGVWTRAGRRKLWMAHFIYPLVSWHTCGMLLEWSTLKIDKAICTLLCKWDCNIYLTSGIACWFCLQNFQTVCHVDYNFLHFKHQCTRNQLKIIFIVLGFCIFDSWTLEILIPELLLF